MRAFIEERLHDPALTPAAFAAAHHISLRWRVVAMQDSRELTLERQALLDDVEALTPEAWRQVSDLVDALAPSRP